MSHRGRTLIANNLVSSTLWHRLACVDPPPSLLAEVQRVLVDFFWGKMHWIPQSVLFLPKEEGGQGLVHLASRGAAFRLQFIQRLLTGPRDTLWRPLSRCILQHFNSLGLDFSLFLMKDNKIVSPSLPGFYKSVFKVWNLLKKATGGLPSLAAAGACPVWDLFRSPPLGTSHPVQSAAGCRGLHAGPGGGASRAWTRRIKKSQLLNFVLGQAKMAVYITRKEEGWTD